MDIDVFLSGIASKGMNTFSCDTMCWGGQSNGADSYDPTVPYQTWMHTVPFDTAVSESKKYAWKI